MIDVEFVDDQSIVNDAELWRRLIPGWIVQDDNTGGTRVSSAAFDDSRDGSPLSVLLAEVIAQTNRTAANVLDRHQGYGLAALRAGDIRTVGQGVMRTPEPDEPAHASVFGRKTGSAKRAMSKAARILIAPGA